MKSRFFTDTQDLDTTPRIADRVCVCLLMNRSACDEMLRQAQAHGLTSGEYIDQLVLGRISPRCSMELPAAKPQGGRSHIAHERAFHQHDLTIEGHDAGQQRQMQHAAGLQPLVHNRKQQ